MAHDRELEAGSCKYYCHPDPTPPFPKGDRVQPSAVHASKRAGAVCLRRRIGWVGVADACSMSPRSRHKKCHKEVVTGMLRSVFCFFLPSEL